MERERFSKEEVYSIYKTAEHLRDLYNEGQLQIYIRKIQLAAPNLSFSTTIQDISKTLEEESPINYKTLVDVAIELVKQLPRNPTDD